MRTDYSYIGSGRIVIRKRGAAAPFIEVGNCSALTIGVTSEEKTLRDFRSPGGGTYNKVARITDVTLAITAHDLSPANLSLALYGNATSISASAIVDEPVVAFKGGYAPLDGNPSSITGIKDKVTPATVYNSPADWVFQYGALFIPSTSGILVPTDADTPNISVSYADKAGSLVQALTGVQQELEMIFYGLNEADSGSASTVKIWRGKFGAAQSIGLIGDDYAGLEMSGSIMADASKLGGTSQYFQTFIEEHA